MLKVRIIPILTFNGFGLVKTKQFANPRMVGNPVQSARVYNSRGVDELVFLDIFASALILSSSPLCCSPKFSAAEINLAIDL